MNKASRSDGIPVELLQILKDDAVKVLDSKFGELSSGHRTGKVQSSFQSQRKAMPKNGSIEDSWTGLVLLPSLCCTLPGQVNLEKTSRILM